jgi:hypothetical protein
LAAAFEEMTTLSQLLFVSAYAIDLLYLPYGDLAKSVFSPVSQCTG